MGRCDYFLQGISGALVLQLNGFCFLAGNKMLQTPDEDLISGTFSSLLVQTNLLLNKCSICSYIVIHITRFVFAGSIYFTLKQSAYCACNVSS